MILPNPPTFITKDNFFDILSFCVKNGVSDLHMQTGKPIVADVSGVFHTIFKKRVSSGEIESILATTYGSTAITTLYDGNILDFSYEIKDDGSRYRFRVNATSCLFQGRHSVQITMRTIPTDPLPLSDLNIEPEIIDAFLSKQGMVLVAGGTGSGKSTLLSSCIRHVIEQEDANSKIVTYESPIEFVYDNILSPSSFVSQSEVPKHVKSFSVGIESALRRKPDIILIGEARDKETIQASILAAQTGHMLYTTTHTNGVVETIRRLVSAFPSDEHESVVLDLIASIKMIVAQRLVPAVSGGRVAIREYMVFSTEIKNELYGTEYQLIPNKIRELLLSSGNTMVNAAKKNLENNIISENTFLMIKRSYS